MSHSLYRLAALGLLLTSLGLAACSSSNGYHTPQQPLSYGATGPATMRPYQVYGRWYYPKADQYYDKVGIASWYGPQFHGLYTSDGEVFNMNALSAAHKTLPIPSYVRVTDLENGRSLILRVNDRGPFVDGRIIDVSRRAAQLLGFEGKGTARVRVQAVTPGGEPEVRTANSAPLSPPRPSEGPSEGPAMPASPAPTVEVAQLAPLSGANSDASKDAGQAIDERTAAPPEHGQLVFVQAGAFSVYGNARRLAQSLRHLGKVTLATIRVNGHDFFRVRLGPFKSMQDADVMLGKIVARGLDSARIVVD